MKEKRPVALAVACIVVVGVFSVWLLYEYTALGLRSSIRDYCTTSPAKTKWESIGQINTSAWGDNVPERRAARQVHRVLGSLPHTWSGPNSGIYTLWVPEDRAAEAEGKLNSCEPEILVLSSRVREPALRLLQEAMSRPDPDAEGSSDD